MKIVFDNIVYSLQRSGGISVVWQELTSRFLKNQEDDLLFLEHESDNLNIFRRLLDIPETNIKVLKPLCLALARYCNPTIRISKPFIFHSSYFRICRNKYARNITTVHDFTYEYFFNHKRKGWFLHVWQRNRAIRHSDAVVCISENTKKDLLKFVKGVNPDKVFVIPNGVSSDYKPIKDEEKVSELKGWLLYVGGRASYKNCYKFVEFIKDTDYKVVFCGSKLTDEEIDLFNNLLGKDRYKVYVNISNYELNRIYNSVKCLVYPSSYEGFGIPVLEAQKAGCPVIALNASSIPEIIGKTPLLMDYFSQSSLLSKLKILDDSATREQIIRYGLLNSSKYSWNNTYELYKMLYRNILTDIKLR